MEPVLVELLAKQDITEAVYRYCRGIDRNDRAAVMSVWHPDGVADYGPGIHTGPAEGFVDWVFGPGRGDRHEMYQHRVHNILIEVRGDRAVSETYFAAHIRGRDEQDKPFLRNFYGRYADEWSRRGDVWAIDKRVELFDFWTVDAPEPIEIGHLGTFDETDRSIAVFGSLDR